MCSFSRIQLSNSAISHKSSKVVVTAQVGLSSALPEHTTPGSTGPNVVPDHGSLVGHMVYNLEN